MKLKIWNGKVFESERAIVAGDNADGYSRNVVVVGVKLEQHSRELLTWALMKIAQPGDRVVALHVMHVSSEEQSSLVSLIKTFDSVLAVYEGFCHLKQVDLKLKVLRGLSVRKILIQEVKLYGAATLVVGTSKAHYPILSPTSVAKHCARKLSHNYSVFAVNNGKIVFGRKASACNSVVYKLSYYSKVASSQHDLAVTPLTKEGGSDPQSKFRSHKHVSGPKRPTLIKRYFSCAANSSWADYAPEPCMDVSLNSALALVPYQTPEASSKQNCEHNNKQGWAFIRRVFLPQLHHSGKASDGKNSILRRLSRWQTQNSAVTVHSQDSQPPDSGGQNGAIVPAGPYTSSPVHVLDVFAEELKIFHSKYSSVCRLFTYQELLSATCGFQPEKIIGQGGSSCVFRGQLSDGKELAVKILKPSENMLKEFINEIEIVTSISHKNIVSLFGFCFENGSPILVYDLLPRGSLEENLLGHKKDVTAFCWDKRYKVALGVAEALDYLHNGTCLPVIHRDVKSSNILVAGDFEPQLADFGLATWSSVALSFTNVAGTFGYMAPEYFMHGKVTEKIDVYAFGVVLLELLTGRKPIDDNNPKGQESLVIWATPVLKGGRILDLLDTSLGRDYENDLAERMGLAAALCLKREPLLRPRINMIVRLLQGDSDVTKWARQQQQMNCSGADFDVLEEETPPKDMQSHLNLAFLDVEDDAFSVSSTEQANVSLEDYLKGRCTRSPSFD